MNKNNSYSKQKNFINNFEQNFQNGNLSQISNVNNNYINNYEKAKKKHSTNYDISSKNEIKGNIPNFVFTNEEIQKIEAETANLSKKNKKKIKNFQNVKNPTNANTFNYSQINLNSQNQNIPFASNQNNQNFNPLLSLSQKNYMGNMTNLGGNLNNHNVNMSLGQKNSQNMGYFQNMQNFNMGNIISMTYSVPNIGNFQNLLQNTSINSTNGLTNQNQNKLKKKTINYNYNSTNFTLYQNPSQNFNSNIFASMNQNVGLNYNMINNAKLFNYINHMNVLKPNTNSNKSTNSENGTENISHHNSKKEEDRKASLNLENKEGDNIIDQKVKIEEINKDDSRKKSKDYENVKKEIETLQDEKPYVNNTDRSIPIQKDKDNNLQKPSNQVNSENSSETRKEIKPIGIFNMDIDRFFESDAKELNLEKISDLQKKTCLPEESHNSQVHDIRAENPEIFNVNKTQNNKGKNEVVDSGFNKESNKIEEEKRPDFEFASENDEKNQNSYDGEENESDEEESSDSSDSIPQEVIAEAFGEFQKEILNMREIPLDEEDDEDFYIEESDYPEEKRQTSTKNNKVIFEDEDVQIRKILNDQQKSQNFKATNLSNINKIVVDEDVHMDNIKNHDYIDNTDEIDSDTDSNNENDHNNEEFNADPLIINMNNNEENNAVNQNAFFCNSEDKADKLEKNENSPDKNKNSPMNKSNIINNQIFNNYNVYNMQMINPNLLNYLNGLNPEQKGNAVMKIIANNMKHNLNMRFNPLSNPLNQQFYIKNNPKNLREQTKAYSDSIKNIDPDLLKQIKNKLTENTNFTKSEINQEMKNGENSVENLDNEEVNLIKSSKISETKEKNEEIDEEKKSNIDIENENKNAINEINKINLTNSTTLEDSIKKQNYMRQMQNGMNGKIPNISQFNYLTGNNLNISKNVMMQNYLLSNYANSIFRGRDSNIQREYLSLKYIEMENPFIIARNIEGFENRILIPIYQKLIFNVNKRKGVYFFTFNRYRKIICRVLQNSKILKKVKPYGSLMNNFMIDSGDIDICIVPNCGILEFAMYLDKIKEELVSQGIAEHKLTHHTSRYMLLKVLDTQTKFVIDITVHNMLPILNTKLIRLYSIYDQRFHILGLYLKHWSKINKIHGAADNYLSSYALLVMLIHFLQKVVEPKVLPNLQKVENKEIIYEYNQNGEVIKTNIYFEEDINKIKQNIKNINSEKENNDSAATLLIKFFEYYSYNYDFYDQKISISNESNENFKTKSDTIAFSIDDPFDAYHNPGKSMTINSSQFNKFMTAMKKEINYVLNGEYLKRLDKLIILQNNNLNVNNLNLNNINNMGLHFQNYQNLQMNQNFGNTNLMNLHAMSNSN